MNAIIKLIKLSEIYGKIRGLRSSTISLYIFNRGTIIPHLKKGGNITVRNYEKAIFWFSDHWPENEQWPDFIKRPSRKEEIKQ